MKLISHCFNNGEATNEFRDVNEFKSFPIVKTMWKRFYYLIFSEAKLQGFW